MRRFRLALLPPRSHWSPWWTAVSLVVHLVLIVLLVWASAVPRRYAPQVMVFVPEGGLGPREVELPAYGPGLPGAPAAAVPAAPLVPSDTGIPKQIGPIVIGRLHRLPGDTVPVPGPIGTGRILGPAYGDGRLWVRVGEAELGVVGPTESAAEHVARVDSVIRARLKAFIDTMPRDSFALPPPSAWTTEIAGKPWGIDERWIYLGDLKLPTALLALLPLPQGNYEQARREAELMRIRQDILDAARRAQTAADFRRYVDELRRRKDAERALERAVRRDTIRP